MSLKRIWEARGRGGANAVKTQKNPGRLFSSFPFEKNAVSATLKSSPCMNIATRTTTPWRRFSTSIKRKHIPTNNCRTMKKSRKLAGGWVGGWAVKWLGWRGECAAVLFGQSCARPPMHMAGEVVCRRPPPPPPRGSSLVTPAVSLLYRGRPFSAAHVSLVFCGFCAVIPSTGRLCGRRGSP